MYLIGDYEKSLVLWHKAKKMRQKQPEVKEAIENICQTIVSSMTNCFAGNDTADIIHVNKLGDIFLCIDSLLQAMTSQHGTVDHYLNTIKDDKEVLSDPNKNLSEQEIRLGKGKTVKKLTRTEKYHEKILLGDLYRDKQFLRWWLLFLNYK